MDQNFVERVKQLVSKAGGQSALSRKTGLSLGAIQRYLRGGEPTRTAMIRLAQAGNVSMNWLVYGREDGVGPSLSSVPLRGFGDSAEPGWFHEITYKISTAMEWPDPDLFAIVAADDSLKSEGISKGVTCIVSPNTRAQKGDIVFVRRKDGAATLKIFESEDSEWLYVRGYMDPVDEAENVDSKESVKKATVEDYGPVICIKRR